MPLGHARDAPMLTSWYSLRVTLGTSMLCVEGEMSSYLRCVKMSVAIRWTLAWPCLPVFDVDMSMICRRGVRRAVGQKRRARKRRRCRRRRHGSASYASYSDCYTPRTADAVARCSAWQSRAAGPAQHAYSRCPCPSPAAPPHASPAAATHLARAALDDDVSALAKSRALHRVGERGTGVGRLEVLVVDLVVGLQRECQYGGPYGRPDVDCSAAPCSDRRAELARTMMG